MRIGVDATCWVNGRGYGRFTRELLRRLAERGAEHRFLLFIERAHADRLDLVGKNLETVAVDLGRAPTEAAAADGARSLGDMLRLTRAVKRARPDVFFFPTVYTYFPMPRRSRTVVTIHDAIAERFPELTLPSLRARLFWKLKVKLAVWQARLVLTVSEFSARDIAREIGVDRSRIRVTLEAPSGVYEPSRSPAEVAAAAARAGLPEGARWIVYVGGFNPHKNVDALVRAHARLARGLDDPPHLLLVGARRGDAFHGCQAGIERSVAAAGTGHLVHWTGFVADEELRHLHSGALCLALPSACEGFGLPAVEAAACGAPVVATTESPLPQLLEGGGLFVEPGDEGALTRALEAMLEDEPRRRAWGETARGKAAELSWDRTADAALAALLEAAA